MAQKTKILVLDHDRGEVRKAAKVLGEEGYEVFCAESARAALDTAHRVVPDLLLLEMASPELEGAEVCRQIRSVSNLAQTKVVQVCGPLRPVPRLEVGSTRPPCESDSYLTRPVTPQLLRVTMQAMMRMRRMEERLSHKDELWRAVFSGVREAILIVDEQLRIIEVNSLAADLFGIRPDELRDLSLLKFCPAETRETISSRMKLASTDYAAVFEMEFLKRDSDPFPAEVEARCIRVDSHDYCELILRDLGTDWNDSGPRALVRELDLLQEYSSDDSRSVAAALYAGGPISQLMPTYFEELASEYSAMVDLALEKRAYRIDRDLTGQLRHLAGRMGQLRAAPRDLIELHTSVLKQKMADSNPRKKQAYNAEGRFMLVELLGHLATYYRDRAIGVIGSGSGE
jgi:PAS domain S-box-containing protein